MIVDTNDGLQMAGPPPIQVTEHWFGWNVQAMVLYDAILETEDADKPSVATHITVDHRVGVDAPYTTFGMAEFRAVVGRATGGNIYGYNLVMHADVGFNKLLQGFEIDLNNYSGADAGPVGSSSAHYGVTFAGSGPHKATGLSYRTGEGNNGGFLAEYGDVYAHRSVSGALINDVGSEVNTFFKGVGAHQYGFQWHGATFSTAWGTVPNNTPLQVLNAAGDALHNLLSYNQSNVILLGQAGLTNGININASLAPNADNAYDIGVSHSRIRTIYTVNSVNVSSDPSHKTDMAPVEDVGGLIDVIHPITFRWKDEAGETGVQWGFNAREVQSAFASDGREFAGCVETESGLFLKPDQLLAVLWAEVRSLRERVAQLEAA